MFTFEQCAYIYVIFEEIRPNIIEMPKKAYLQFIRDEYILNYV